MKNKGFSLIEILIALAIIAAMIVVAFPNLTQNTDKLAKKEVLRLVSLIEMVRDQSVILNREYGLRIDEKGYQFLVLNEDEEDKPARWQVIDDIAALGEYQFPENLEINLTIDGENIFSTAEDEIDIFEEDIEIFSEEEEEKKVEPPQIYFLSSGEINQFSIGISVAEWANPGDDERVFYRVRGFLTGNLKYEGPLQGNLFQDLDREFDQENS